MERALLPVGLAKEPALWAAFVHSMGVIWLLAKKSIKSTTYAASGPALEQN